MTIPKYFLQLFYCVGVIKKCRETNITFIVERVGRGDVIVIRLIILFGNILEYSITQSGS